MSSYIAWFEQSDDSDVESFIEEEAWARQYMYNKDNKANESNGEQSFEGEHKFQDQDSEYAVGEEEEENEQSLEIKNKNDQKKKKKKKKKKTKAVNTDQDGQKINIQYVDVENDEFFLRMKHEEMERVREHMEKTRARAKDLNQIDFCASFLQCFKMSFTKESKLSTNRHRANELEDESSTLMPLGKNSSSKRTAPIVLKRHSQTMCYYGNQLFMFGGTNEHFRFSDLIAYDMDTKTWRNIRVEEIHTGKPLNVRPPTSFMFSMSNHLVLYTSGNSFFIMERALERSMDKYPDEISYRHYNCTHNSASIDTTAVMVKDYSAATVGTKLYTFGGTVDGFSTQILQIFSFTTSRTGQLVVEKFPSFYTSSYGRPPPRSKHGCAVIGTDLYIFGGYCERKNVNYHHTKKLMYNDMFVYRATSDTWKEVDVKGVSPPPMYGFSMTAIHHFIYVYGGFTEDEEIQSDIYRFDTKNLSWSVILVRGVSFPSTSSPTDYQVPCAQHTAVEINGNRIAIVGGVYDSETQKKVVYPNNFLIINEASDEGTGKQLIDYLWSCVEKDHYSDLHLRCADRQTGEAVYLTVHRAMLAARSPYFAKLLQEFEPVEFTEEGVAIMEITDYYSDTVLSFVRFLYKAELKVSGAQQVLDILKCSEEWGHFDTLAAICNGGSRYLDLSAKVMTDLTNDFKRLFLESIEEFDWESIPDLFMFDVLPNKSSDGLKKYTDACVQLLNDDNEVSLKLTGHKLFLCRAQHIFNAFNSGMEETLTSNIQFNGLSREGLMGVLKFLYTDEIDVNPEIAIEVLLASHMFNLPILSSYCCKVIMENVDKGNVLQILDIADTYHNAELRRRCLTFFMKHHAELRKDEAFSFLSDDLKRVVDMDLIPQTLKLEMRRKRRDMLRYKNRVNKK